MIDFKTYFLTEGGAAGHMQHPFDIPTVKTGKDLISFFDKAFQIVKRNKASLKIDGINVSVKLINTGTNDNPRYEFALDRGSMKPLDAKGITVTELETRFGKGHGMVAAGEKTLSILNSAIPSITPELQKLGFFKDPSLFFNTEFVQGRTNVLSYDHDFLAIHGVNKFYQATPGRRGSMEVAYDQKAMVSLINKLNKIANEHNFKIYGDVPAVIKSTPNFSKVLSHPFTMLKDGKKYVEPLKIALDKAVNPFDKKIKLTSGKFVPAMGKEVYLNILNGTPVENFVADKKDFKSAIDGALFYHATRVLGAEFLKTVHSDMGEADKHEGIVLRNNALSSKPVKITGDFIVRGMESQFKRGVTPEEDDENTTPYMPVQMSPFTHPPYDESDGVFTVKPMTSFTEMANMATQQMVVGNNIPAHKRVLVVYPGRFQPFTKNHAQVYNHLKNEFPHAQVYIATTDKVEHPRSPFNFEQKLEMILASGVDPSMVVKTADPYKVPELVNKYDKTMTVLIFAVGEKDMNGPTARFKFNKKKDGSPSFFQRFKSLDDCKSLSEHGYVVPITTKKSTVGGKQVQDASQIRDMYAVGNDALRKHIITDLYGKYSEGIRTIFDKELARR